MGLLSAKGLRLRDETQKLPTERRECVSLSQKLTGLLSYFSSSWHALPFLPSF